MITITFILLWAIFIIYWLSGSKNVKSTKEFKRRSPMLWVVIGIAVLMSLIKFTSLIPLILISPLFYVTFTINIIGIIFAIIGLIIAISARITLGKNWSSAVVLKEKHQLITSGVYSYVRHPIYSGVLLMILGSAITLASPIAILILLAVLVTYIFKINDEEKLLSKYFAKEYIKYKKHTKVLIPYVW